MKKRHELQPAISPEQPDCDQATALAELLMIAFLLPLIPFISTSTRNHSAHIFLRNPHPVNRWHVNVTQTMKLTPTLTLTTTLTTLHFRAYVARSRLLAIGLLAVDYSLLALLTPD